MTAVVFPSPVLVASGCGGTGRELAAYVELAALGAFVTRTVTRDPRPGGPMPRVVESPSGFVHAVGLQNPGIDAFLATELPWLVRQGARVVVSIAGGTLGEYTELTRRLAHAPGVSGVEVNVSEPDVAGLGLFDAREPVHAASVVSAVRRDLPRDLPVLVKLRPDPGRVVESARTVVDAGADAVVLANAAPALFPDGRAGGLSGPALRPVALRCVRDVHAALPNLPIIAAGGVADAGDARAYLAAGALAVQVGSALLHDPTAAARIAADLEGDLA